MTKLYVGSLPYSITDESLLQLFTEKGYQPVSARVITDRDTGRSRGYGFVELGPEDDAARVIGALNGTNVEGPCAPGQRSTSAGIPWLWRSFRWRTRIFWRSIWPRT